MKTTLLKSFYLPAGLITLINGLWMVLLPLNWVTTVPFGIEASDPMVAHFISTTGAGFVLVGLSLLWCLRNLETCAAVHWQITIFFVLLSGNDLINPVHGDAAINQAIVCLLVFTPAVLLVLLGLPYDRFFSGAREQGTVKWFNATKGFGFITTATGEDVFVHYRSIRGNGRRALREGQQVEFRISDGEKGLQADDVSKLN